jgi:hypothetical protein
MEEIIVGIHIGDIILSFKTDPTGSNVKKGLESIKQFLKDHETLLKKYSGDVLSAPSERKQNLRQNLTHSGRAETSLILVKIEGALLPKNYFKSARTTGEVKSELKVQTGIDFTSRKVSQALGTLFNKHVLSRVGSKGNFRYLQN